MNDNIDINIEENKIQFKDKIKYLINEIIKKHDKDDYQELFFEDKNKKSIPWFSIRFFILSFIIYSFSMFICFINKWVNNYYFPIALGCVFIGISLLIFTFEIIKERDIGLFKLLLIGIIGGFISFILSAYISYIIKVNNSLYQAIKAGVIEELLKGITCIITIVLIKKKGKEKKKPITGFAIGLSIGGFFGIIENFNYLFLENFRYVIDITMLRGFDQIITHMLWCGLIGYAYLKFRRPFINIKFWLFVLLSMLLHFAWDLEVGEEYHFIQNICIIVYTIISIVYIIFIIVRNNKFVESDIDLFTINKKDLMKTHFITGLFICVIFLLLDVAIASKGNLTNDTKEVLEYYMDFDEFEKNISNNYINNIDRNRPYDDTIVDYDRYYKMGQLIYARQVESNYDVNYLYSYSMNESGELYVNEVSIIIDEKVYNECYMPTSNDDIKIYYEINETMSNNNYVYDNGKVYIESIETSMNFLFYLIMIIGLFNLLLGGVITLFDYSKYKKNFNGE